VGVLVLAVAVAVALVAALEELDDRVGDVDAGGLLDALEAGGGVDLEDDGAVVGAEDVDAGDLEAEDLGGVDRRCCAPRG
jgi:hypothetical protein